MTETLLSPPLTASVPHPSRTGSSTAQEALCILTSRSGTVSPIISRTVTPYHTRRASWDSPCSAPTVADGTPSNFVLGSPLSGPYAVLPLNVRAALPAVPARGLSSPIERESLPSQTAVAALQRQLEDRVADIKGSMVSLLESLKEVRHTGDEHDEAVRRTMQWFPSAEMVHLHETCLMLLRQCTRMEEVVVRSTVLEAARRYLVQAGFADLNTTGANAGSPLSSFQLPKPTSAFAHAVPERPSVGGLFSGAATLSDALLPHDEEQDGDDAATLTSPLAPATLEQTAAPLSGLCRFVDLELFLLQQQAQPVQSLSASPGASFSASAIPTVCVTRTLLPLPHCADAGASVVVDGSADTGVAAVNGTDSHADAEAFEQMHLVAALAQRPGMTASRASSITARASWTELVATLASVWQDVKQTFPIDAHYYDALDFLHTWGSDWYAFEVRQVPPLSGEGPSLHVGQGSPSEAAAVEELSRRLWGCESSPECFGTLLAKVIKTVELSGYGCQKNVPLSLLVR